MTPRPPHQPSPHRLLAVLTAEGDPAALVDHAHRWHRALGGPWSVLAVDTPDLAPDPNGRLASLLASLDRAERLGASVARLSLGSRTGTAVIPALVRHVETEQVDVLLLGRPRLAPPLGTVGPPPLGQQADLIADLLPGVTVHVVTPGEAGPAPLRPRGRPPRDRLNTTGPMLAVGAMAAATGLGLLMESRLHATTLVMVYLAAVAVVAARSSRRVALLTVAGCIALYDLIFVPPRWSFKPTEPEQAMALAVMLGVSLLIGHLATRSRVQAATAEARAQRAQAMARLAGQLTTARERGPVLQALQEAMAQALQVPVHVVDALDDLQARRHPGIDPEVARAVLDGSPAAGPGGTPGRPGDALYLPVGRLPRPTAIAVLHPPPGAPLSLDDLHLARAMASQATLALERASYEQRSTEAAVQAERERLRSTLLAGISHDFRTPLTTIIGNAGTLRDQGEALAPDRRRQLLQHVVDEAQRLHRLGSDLLDLTRLEAGAVQPALEWCPTDEILAEALHAMRARLLHHQVRTDAAEDGLLWCDPRLIVQALNNLLDNAARHTPAGGLIRVALRAYDGQGLVVVHDSGPGIPPGHERSVFEPYRRPVPDADADPGGKGLGLAICAAVAVLHGGSIRAEHDGGARITMSWPQPPVPPALEASA